MTTHFSNHTKLKTSIRQMALIGTIGLGFSSAAMAHSDHSHDEVNSSDDQPHIMVSNNPLLYFTSELAGDKAVVSFPIHMEGDPAFWEPKAEDIVHLQSADLIVINGAGHEKWLNTVSLPKRRIFDSSASFKQDYIPLENSITHSHGPGGEHSHNGYAFTTWMDMSAAISQVSNISHKLTQRWPSLETEVQGNLGELEQKLIGLDKQYQEQLSRLDGEYFVFSHPVYQYFERRYQLNGHSLHWEPDMEPTAEQWKELEALASKHQARVLVWEGEPLAATVEGLKARGFHSVVVSPASNDEEGANWMDIQEQNIQNLKKLAASL